MRLSILAIIAVAALETAAQGAVPPYHPIDPNDPPLGNAKPVKDNPTSAAYVAKFEPDSISSISGNFFAVSDAMGTGTNFHVTLTGMPKGMGPFGE